MAEGSAALGSKRESRFEIEFVSGPSGVLAGSRKEAWASDARGESKSTGSDAFGIAGAGSVGNSAMELRGAPGRTGTTGGGTLAEGRFNTASSPHDQHN